MKFACKFFMLLFVYAPLFPGQAGVFFAVTGHVTTTSGALMPGVKIRVRSLDTGETRTTVTDESGKYRIENVPPGKYTVSASLPTFQTKNVVNVPLTFDIRLNFELVPERMADNPEVDIPFESLLTIGGRGFREVLRPLAGLRETG
jgi:hypothetical protein